jgi:predicted site-specific integrase-resolvase
MHQVYWWGMRLRFSYRLGPQRRKLVADPGETTDDPVQEMIDVLTSFRARLHSRRGAYNLRAVTCAKRAPGAGPAGGGDLDD